MAKASNPPAEVTRRRLNLRGILILLGAVLVVGLIVLFPGRAYLDGKTRASALAQAQASEKAGDVDLALRHMERYVANWPQDEEGLEYLSKLLAETARTPAQLMNAAQVNDQALRLDPEGEASQAIRRRLIRLYVQYGDYIRVYAAARKEDEEAKSQLRYRAAEKLARQLLERGAKDAEAHRLLALSLEGIVVSGDRKLLDQAVDAYRETLKLEPTDTLSAERLAELLVTYKQDKPAALATLDALLQADPKSVAARMARHRFFIRQKDDDQARAEMAAASDLAPRDPAVQAAAASDAMQRRDYAEARRHLDAIPDEPANQLRLRALRGMLELNEKHPDEAIEEWRKGLIATAGSDLELTWQLAHTLIQLGRLEEAKKLVNQFQRLGGEENEPMGRFLRALFELRGGHPKSALKDLTRVANQVPQNWRPEVQMALGRANESLGFESEALLAYQKAKALAPSAVEPSRAISRIMAARNPADSANEMERALAQNPNDLALLVEVGRMRLRQQALVPEDQRLWTGVDAVVNRAAQIDPNNFAVQTLQADVLAASGRLDQALALLEKSVEGPGKGKQEIWLTLAGALDRLNRPADALKAVEQASEPGAAGDHAGLRIARARLLTKLGQAQAARNVLSKDREKLPLSERPELAHALAELCRELGDRDGARAALADWSRLLPDSAEPGLALLAFAQTNDDDEAAKLGLESLRSLGGDQEPYGLAARVLELLRVSRARADGVEPVVAKDPAELKRLDEADKLVAQLVAEAPQLPVVPMLQGMIAERRGQLDQAIEAYRRSIKDVGAPGSNLAQGALSPAVARLVELLARRERFEEIAQLKARYEARANADGTPSLVTGFDQILAAVWIRLNNVKKAEESVDDMLKEQPDNFSIVINKARLLGGLNQGKEGEAAIRRFAARHAADPGPWVALVAFRLQHPELGDVNQAVDEARAGYKGPYPELLAAKCRWVARDIPGATKLYDAAVAKNGDDLTTLREAAEFDDANGRGKEEEAKLRRALKVDPKASWASRTLALVLSNRPDKSGWDEAWELVKPGAPGVGQTPEDRLARATVLARSPVEAQRAEAVAGMKSLGDDLPASSPIAIEARTRLAQAQLEAGQYNPDFLAEAARTIAPVADDLERPNPTGLALSIEALARLKRPAEALKQLERLQAIEPNSPRTAASKAWALAAAGKPDDAYRAIESAYAEAEAGPDGERLALAFQDLLVKIGQQDNALKLAERIAAKWPKDAYLLARAQLGAGKVAEAIKSCQIALEAGEVRETVRVASAIAGERRGDAAALQSIDDIASAALAQAPKSPDVLTYVSLLRHLQGRYDEEMAMYRQILEVSPEASTYLNNMAWTLSEGLQRYDEALERIDEAIRRLGRVAEFLDTRGVILTRLNRLDEAIADFEESTKIRPSATTYFHLARAYRMANKTADYRRCRDLANKAKLDRDSLDPSDKADLSLLSGN